MKLLVVVDMQNDFVTGVLGTKEAKDIVNDVVSIVKEYDGEVVYTMDTHTANYMDTMEGSKLPVIHCVKGTKGWELVPELKNLLQDKRGFAKPSFGSIDLMEYVKEMSKVHDLEEIALVGVCTDICVISNAMLLKAAVPETKIKVYKDATAGVTKDSHENALNAMKMCHIDIE